MKEIVLICSAILIMLSLTSCFNLEARIGGNESQIADDTFNNIIEAIKEKNSLKIKELFSENVQKNNADLEQKAIDFFEFVEGDILSYSQAKDGGVSTTKRNEHGKKKIVINSSFTVETAESIYHIAINQCLRNDFQKGNEGILSLSIIEDSNWNKEYRYRVAVDEPEGIYIIRERQ